VDNTYNGSHEVNGHRQIVFASDQSGPDYRASNGGQLILQHIGARDKWGEIQKFKALGIETHNFIDGKVLNDGSAERW